LSPSDLPTGLPSEGPSLLPSDLPSHVPSLSPTESTSGVPSLSPSGLPSGTPSELPSNSPSNIPSLSPSDLPTGLPSEGPSLLPSDLPNQMPTLSPAASTSDLAFGVNVLLSEATRRLLQISETCSVNATAFADSLESLLQEALDGIENVQLFVNSCNSSAIVLEGSVEFDQGLTFIEIEDSVNKTLANTEELENALNKGQAAQFTIEAVQYTVVPSVSTSPSDVPSDVPLVTTSPTVIPSYVPSASTSPYEVPSDAPSVSSSPSEIPSGAPSFLNAPTGKKQSEGKKLRALRAQSSSAASKVPKSVRGSMTSGKNNLYQNPKSA